MKINKPELYFFYLVVFINLFPFISYKFFPTMDGAAHLYNSNLITELLRGNPRLNSFYEFNHIPVPNWSGHFLLALFNTFLPAWMAEKILLVFYAISFPLVFRNLIKIYSPENTLLSYLIFPFIYSALFYLGFYNFYLGIIFLLITTVYWINNMATLTLKKGILLFCLITITYFCHLFSYVLLISILSLLLLQDYVRSIINNGTTKNVKSKFNRQLTFLVATSFFTVLMFIKYLLIIHISGDNQKLGTAELFKWISDVKPLIALNREEESPYTIKYFYLLLILTAIALYVKIQNIKQTTFAGRNSVRALFYTFHKSDVWIIVFGVALILFFKVPNGANAGMMSDRLCLLFFIFYIVWIATQPLPKWLGVVSAVSLLYFNLGLLSYHIKTTRDLSNDAVEYNSVAEHIDENSVVLPINYSTHWLQGHFSNYMGIDKPLIILENYEATLDWFPVKWKNNETVDRMRNHNSCDIGIDSKKENIDYIVIWGREQDTTDNCVKKFKEGLQEHYDLVYESPRKVAHLYKLKKRSSIVSDGNYNANGLPNN